MNHVHQASIKVRKGTGKKDIDGEKVFEEFPATVHWICKSLGKRSNGEPKPEGVETLTQDEALAAIAAAMEVLGVHTVVDAYNHGHDLRVRASRRPKSNKASKALCRQQAVLYIMSDPANLDLFTGYQDALAMMDEKLSGEFLDKVYDDNVATETDDDGGE